MAASSFDPVRLAARGHPGPGAAGRGGGRGGGAAGPLSPRPRRAPPAALAGAAGASEGARAVIISRRWVRSPGPCPSAGTKGRRPSSLGEASASSSAGHPPEGGRELPAVGVPPAPAEKFERVPLALETPGLRGLFHSERPLARPPPQVLGSSPAPGHRRPQFSEARRVWERHSVDTCFWSFKGVVHSGYPQASDFKTPFPLILVSRRNCTVLSNF